MKINLDIKSESAEKDVANLPTLDAVVSKGRDHSYDAGLTAFKGFDIAKYVNLHGTKTAVVGFFRNINEADKADPVNFVQLSKTEFKTIADRLLSVCKPGGTIEVSSDTKGSRMFFYTYPKV